MLRKINEASESNCINTNIVRGGGKSDQDGNDVLNSALVFIKPHANTEAVQSLVQSKLLNHGVSILSEFEITGTEIDRDKLIDQHYYAIASKATILNPRDMGVPESKFEDFFGESWKKVQSENRAVNAMQACERFGCSATELNEVWKKSEAGSKVVKFGGGFYCGLISFKDMEPLYVFNAFFMSMRSRFVGDEDSIHCYEVQWHPEDLSWEDFRGKVLGPTDPRDAPKASIRKDILKDYKKLGLKSIPNKSDNGVHASASPFEGLAERMNWMKKRPDKDDFGKTLLRSGVSKKLLKKWSLDPRVNLPDGTFGSIFDFLEDMDAPDCLNALKQIKSLN